MQKLTRNIKVNLPTVTTLATVGRIDEPADGATVTSKTMTVRGWALAESGVKEIRVLVDGKLKATTNTGLSRPDIASAYPQYNNAGNAGFQINVDISDIENGSKTIVAEVVGNDGSVQKLTRNIKVNLPELSKTLGRIDEPTTNVDYYKNTIKIRGWAINKSGVSEVRVYVNGTNKGTITYGTSRPDVNAAYPGYPSEDKAGYEGTIDISDVSLGLATIKVVVKAKDGGTQEFTTSINLKANGSKLVVVDPGHENPGGDPGATATHNGISYIESNLNLQIAIKLKSELEKKGITVLMTRNTGTGQIAADSKESLIKRVNFANEVNADFFISIHHNTYTSASANGFEVYYSSASPETRGLILDNGEEITFERNLFSRSETSKVAKSREIATLMAKEVSSNLSIYNRGAKDNDFYVVKNTKMPSVLVENGFLSNPTEAEKVSKESYQQKLSEILADIINKNI